MFGNMLKRTLLFIIVLAGCFSALAEQELEKNSQALHVLFLGNSLTFMPDETNTHPVTPELVKAFLNSRHIENDIEWVTAGGHTLENHWSEGKFQKKLLEKPHGYFKYVFIQPYSVEALELPPCFQKLGPNGIKGPEGREMFLEYAQKMIHLVEERGSIPIVIEPWIYEAQHPWLQSNFECLKFPGTDKTWYGGSQAALERNLEEGYSKLQSLTFVEVLRIGPLWQELREHPDSDFSVSMLYQADHYHPSYLGALLSAFVITERLTHTSADQLTFCPAQVDPKKAAFLRKLAMIYFKNAATVQ